MTRATAALIFVAALLTAGPAAGQLSLVGGGSPVGILGTEFAGGLVRGTSVAYDPVNGVYLVVGAYGTARGVFVNGDGVPVSASFLISPQTGWSHFPRVVYSGGLANGVGGLGAFLVTWHDTPPGGSANFVHARVVSVPAGGPIGSTSVVSDTASWWEAGAPAAYSPATGTFLVVWQTCCGGNSVIRGQRLMIDGNGTIQLLGGGMAISATYGRDPGVAHNPATDQFGVSFSGGDHLSATVSLALITPAGGMPFRLAFYRSAATYISDIAVNTNNGRYVVLWSDGSGTRGAEFTAGGTHLAMGVVANIIGTYDAVAISFNPTSRTFLLTGHHAFSGEVGAAELSSRGARVSAETTASDSGNLGAFYPRAESNGSRWLDSFARKFDSVRVQAVLTSSTNGAGDVGLPPVGNPPPPDPPVIVAHPQSSTIAAGASTTLSVTATGPSLSYQWYQGISPNTSAPIGGATSNVFTTPALGTTTRYWVRVSNGNGTADSNTATVTPSHIFNGGFSSGSTGWSTFATPDQSYIQANVVNGMMSFFRVPPPGGSNQATVFQNTGHFFNAGTGIRAIFNLGNSSSVRKRISVLLTDADFSDHAVCTFWLPPNSPLQTYAIQTHTNEAWTNASIYFYAASMGSDGGSYLIDDVILEQDVTLPTSRTNCVDPKAPPTSGLPSSGNLIINGTFDPNSIPPWVAFGALVYQVPAGVVEMIQPSGTSGAFLQQTFVPVNNGEIMFAAFSLGNSSGVRKRVTVLLHDSDFSDLSVCSFWLQPGAPLSSYAMLSFATKAWANATLSFYVATTGNEPWIRLDNVILHRTPSTATVGTECLEPGGASIVIAEALRSSRGTGSIGRAPESGVPSRGAARPAPPVTSKGLNAIDLEHNTQLIQTMDLRGASRAAISFESFYAGDSGTAELQVSEDGVTWDSVMTVPASDAWLPLSVDLSPYAGRVIRVRFVRQVGASESTLQLGTWRISDLRLWK